MYHKLEHVPVVLELLQVYFPTKVLIFELDTESVAAFVNVYLLLAYVAPSPYAFVPLKDLEFITVLLEYGYTVLCIYPTYAGELELLLKALVPICESVPVLLQDLTGSPTAFPILNVTVSLPLAPLLSLVYSTFITSDVVNPVRAIVPETVPLYPLESPIAVPFL